jgi:hypothetical protein
VGPTIGLDTVVKRKIFAPDENKKIKIKLFLCLTNQTLRHEDVWGSGGIIHAFIDIGTSWLII